MQSAAQSRRRQRSDERVFDRETKEDHFDETLDNYSVFIDVNIPSVLSKAYSPPLGGKISNRRG